MSAGLVPAAWTGLFGAAAAASAGLLGLIFVAVSLHLHEVESRPTLRLGARLNLQALGALLVVSLVGLIPGQGDVWLGGELLVIASIYSWLALVQSRRTSKLIGGLPRDQRRRILVQNTVLLLLQGAAAVSLIAGAGPGLYLEAPTILIGLPITVFNSWNIIFAPELHGRIPPGAVRNSGAGAGDRD